MKIQADNYRSLASFQGYLKEPWTFFALIIVAGYIVLNAGFSLLRVPPVGPGIPIGEIFIFISIFRFFSIDRTYAIAFLNSIPLPYFGIFWSIGVCHLVIDGPEAGFWAFRDAAHLFETLFTWIGFVVVFRVSSFEILYGWLRLTLRVALIYALTYPVREALVLYSPQISSAGAYSVPLFFSFINTSSSVICGMVFALTDKWSKSRNVFLLVGGLALLIVVALVQVRVAYLQLLAVTGIVALFGSASFGRWLRLLLIAVVGVVIFASLDLDFEGRLGTRFTLDFLWNHVQAIWGGGDSSVQGAAEGVGLRLRWWNDVSESVFADPFHTLFGTGFGHPLTTFEGPEGDITREPHNSFISVLARYGVLGLLAFVCFQIHLFATVISSIVMSRRANNTLLHHYLLTAFCFFAVNLLFSVVEGGFEVSYVAIPYYFFAGTVYALSRKLRTSNQLAETSGSFSKMY